MPYKGGELTLKERAFIQAYVDNGGDRAGAERASGLSTTGCYKILGRPDVQQAIVESQMTRLQSEALPLAVGTLMSIMRSDKAPAAARVQAAKAVLDRALPALGDGQVRNLHEMTPEEIARAISALEAQAAAVARDVTAPSLPGPPSSTDVFG